MIKRNILIVIRHLWKYKINSFVNVLGLTISLTAFILLGTYVSGELRTDRFHKQSDRIYAVSLTNGNSLTTPAILSRYVNNSIPGVEKTVRCQLFIRNYTTVRYADNLPIQSKIIFADSTVFDVFSFKCIEGKLSESLNSPNSMVITRSEAKKLFGVGSPVGKTLKVAEKGELTITAMIEDLPVNSSFDFTGIANLNSIRSVHPFTLDCGWRCSNVETYVLLSEKQSVVSVQKKINDQLGALLKEHEYTSVTLLPYKDLYFDAKVQTELRHGNIKQIWILMLISFLIVLIAVINYVNLSTSQASLHSQTTGIKKMFGAARSGLVGQFIMESIFISLISFLLAVMMSNMLSPMLNQLLGTSLSGIAFFSRTFWFGLLGTGIILGSLSGLYPAYFLSAVSPIMVIKNEINKGKRAVGFRRGLIVFQFSISIFLIICTLLINSQLKYVLTSNPGFSKENLLLIRMSPKMTGKYEVLRQTILQNPSVKDVVFSESYPGNMIDHWTTMVQENGEKKKVSFTAEMIEPEYIEKMGMKMSSGRSFQKNIKSETGAFIINETAVREFGLKNPLNAEIDGFDGKTRPIVGVVRDYNFESLYNPIKPLVLFCGNDQFMNATVRFQVRNAAEMDKMISSLKKSYTSLDSSFPFDMKWFDETVEQMYLKEKSLKALILLFSTLAIFVACLGLFALSLYETEQKSKEIGIRKVNGAKVLEVIAMLNKDFVKWVVIAFLISTPVAYYAMRLWLNNFAYKTDLSWWIFALAGLLALGIALLTVSWQSWKAATRNPVEALRYE